ncbi:MAG: phosphoribosylformylglycinamidine cyclo-ligase, partial [Rhodospirillales bacterium]
EGHYDLAGFCVGAVERQEILPRPDVMPGDLIIGLKSTGVHSNGFSLVRKVVERAGLGWDDASPFSEDETVAEAFLTPTRMYVKSCLAAVRAGGVKALAHITGGGLVENIPRILPDGMGAEIDAASWHGLPVFSWLKETGNVNSHEMFRAFNAGIGMIVIVGATRAESIAQILHKNGEKMHIIGQVTENNTAERVKISNGDKLWQS